MLDDAFKTSGRKPAPALTARRTGKARHFRTAPAARSLAAQKAALAQWGKARWV
jgi:hypothetical protein